MLKLCFTDFIYKGSFVVAWCPIPTLTHGSVSPLYQDCPNEQCWVATQVSFSCDPEYHLSGNGQVRCVGYGEWDPAIPICEGKPG